MASSDRAARLVAIRDAAEKMYQDYVESRAAVVAAGGLPPVSYSIDGKSIQWSELRKSMLQEISDLNDLVNKTGADGGIPNVTIRGWT